jgi:hypothetical protein
VAEIGILRVGALIPFGFLFVQHIALGKFGFESLFVQKSPYLVGIATPVIGANAHFHLAVLL